MRQLTCLSFTFSFVLPFLQDLMILLSLLAGLLQDRVIFACTAFVSNILGQKFVEPPMLDLGDSLNDSVPHSPLLFILSAGIEIEYKYLTNCLQEVLAISSGVYQTV